MLPESRPHRRDVSTRGNVLDRSTRDVTESFLKIDSDVIEVNVQGEIFRAVCLAFPTLHARVTNVSNPGELERVLVDFFCLAFVHEHAINAEAHGTRTNAEATRRAST